MGITRWLLKLVLVPYALMTAALLCWTFLWRAPDMGNLDKSDAIICLGGGMAANGTLDASVLTRIDRCVQLYEASLAPKVVFTGGVARQGGPEAGTQMAHYAETLGLPAQAAIVEPAAQSTLQNALFSLDLLPQATRVIVVSEAFHLPRSWVSFHWAAWEQDRPLVVATAMSETVRRDPVDGSVNWRILWRESLAIWFNVARAAGYSAAPDPSVDWLH